MIIIIIIIVYILKSASDPDPLDPHNFSSLDPDPKKKDFSDPDLPKNVALESQTSVDNY